MIMVLRTELNPEQNERSQRIPKTKKTERVCLDGPVDCHNLKAILSPPESVPLPFAVVDVLGAAVVVVVQ